MPIAIRERDGIGRCAVTAGSTKRGDAVLVEKAALYWQQGPNELLDIIRAYQAADKDDKTRIDDLTSEILDASPELDEMIQSWRDVLQQAKEAGSLPIGDIEADLIPILLKAHFNAHAVQSPDGACLFPQGAMLNHSCSPNTFYRCAAHTIQFIASNDMQEGTELTAAYLDAMTMLKPTKYRQTVLLLSKGFFCACERCTAETSENTRAVKCPTESCQGVLLPSNVGLRAASQKSACTWQCRKCDMILSSDAGTALSEKEDAFYGRWKELDSKLTHGEAVQIKDINQLLEQVSQELHPSQLIPHLLRVLLIEVGVDGGVPRSQHLAHSYIYAQWLYDQFQEVPVNLLGTMTGALANLFDRKTHMITAGLNIDRVLTIIKTVLPHATLRYGQDAAYPKALKAVVDTYSQCSSLICQNTGKLMRCGRCDSVAYCSRSCQIFHYKSQGHKAACASIVEVRKQLSGLGVQ